MNIEAIYEIFSKNINIITDSRKAEAHSIFFALKGDSFDGNQFALKAIERGCSYAIVDNPQYKQDDRFILVQDVLNCLQKLAQYHRRILDIPIIAITGTNGKTTTKELINVVLSKKYNTGFTKGNLNNHIGVPLTLLSFNKDTEIGIVEMGANHIGEIAQLCEIAEPNYGLITNVGSAHLEGFGSFEGVKIAKGEMYEWLFDNGGLAFVNSDNEHLLGMLHPQRNFTYGSSNLAECSGELLPTDGFFMCAQAILHIDDEQTVEMVQFYTQLLGNYNFENTLAAAAIGRYFGVKGAEIKTAIDNYQPSNNRSQLVHKENNTILLDAYNANPTSMHAAIENISSLEIDNKVTILGDMLELGEHSKSAHQEIVDLLSEKKIAKVYLVGSEFSNTKTSYSKFLDSDSLIDFLSRKPINHSNILIKGSRGIGLEKVLIAL